MSQPQGFLLVVNGRPLPLRGVSLELQSGKLPVWLVDVDGRQGRAGTWDAALVLAARAAEAAKEEQ